MAMDLQLFTDYKDKIVSNCSKVIVGKDDVIRLVLICFVCSGHVLLEDVPGTGKTMLLRAFAKSVGGNFKRIQFTPDLLPSDLTGINFYNQKKGDFEFRPGPLFSNIVLADEINRATPRTQSSLLEAMEERQITVDGTTTKLDEPFMVMATQNPIESYGTFPLPEAQTDRFFMRLSLGYMTRSQELGVIARRSTLDIVNSLETVVTKEETQRVKTSSPPSRSDDVANIYGHSAEKRETRAAHCGRLDARRDCRSTGPPRSRPLSRAGTTCCQRTSASRLRTCSATGSQAARAEAAPTACCSLSASSRAWKCLWRSRNAHIPGGAHNRLLRARVAEPERPPVPHALQPHRHKDHGGPRRAFRARMRNRKYGPHPDVAREGADALPRSQTWTRPVPRPRLQCAGQFTVGACSS